MEIVPAQQPAELFLQSCSLMQQYVIYQFFKEGAWKSVQT